MGHVRVLRSFYLRRHDSRRGYPVALRPRQPGKLASLYSLIAEQYEALESDWLRFYSRDLREDLWGTTPVGVRRIAALVKNLPAESSTVRELNKDWNADRELSAVTVELLHSILRTYVSANSKAGTRLPEPLHIPRPWDTPKGRPNTGTTLAELQTILKEGRKAAR